MSYEDFGDADIVEDKDGNVYRIYWDGENSGGTPWYMSKIKEVKDAYPCSCGFSSPKDLPARLELKIIGREVTTRTIKYYKETT